MSVYVCQTVRSILKMHMLAETRFLVLIVSIMLLLLFRIWHLDIPCAYNTNIHDTSRIDGQQKRIIGLELATINGSENTLDTRREQEPGIA